MDAIACKNIWKIYNKDTPAEVQALRGVNLRVKKGEFISIVGRSGSGKSTLLNMLGALDVPTKGSIFIDGVNISTLKDNQLAVIRRKKIGFVFQSFNLINSLTSLENVMLPMVFNGISPSQRIEKAKNLLAKVDLEKKFHTRPNKMSGGENQRVSIARALANNPTFILADEPTGNLDSKNGKNIMDILKKLNKDDITIIIVTHDPKVARQAQRIVRMSDGKIMDGL
ncbi:MAG: ABC transporter ATP-binding protein [Candidatus Aenigmarchaeota archaeon]|nr:ABC transporter ATP-binding protein [Candidatus Aenigmarchaeota archaeon]